MLIRLQTQLAAFTPEQPPNLRKTGSLRLTADACLPFFKNPAWRADDTGRSRDRERRWRPSTTPGFFAADQIFPSSPQNAQKQRDFRSSRSADGEPDPPPVALPKWTTQDHYLRLRGETWEVTPGICAHDFKEGLVREREREETKKTKLSFAGNIWRLHLEKFSAQKHKSSPWNAPRGNTLEMTENLGCLHFFPWCVEDFFLPPLPFLKNLSMFCTSVVDSSFKARVSKGIVPFQQTDG